MSSSSRAVLRLLQMRRDSVNIKTSETEENRRAHELNIAYLKEEKLDTLLKLDSLRKSIVEHDILYRKMIKVKDLSDKERNAGLVS